jgi:hypothetical protein
MRINHEATKKMKIFLVLSSWLIFGGGAKCKSPAKDMAARKQWRSVTGRASSAKTARIGRARWSKRQALTQSVKGWKRRRRNLDALSIRNYWLFRLEKKKRPDGGSISRTAPLESRAHSRLAKGPRSKIQRKPLHISPTRKQSLEIKGTMLNPRDIEPIESELTTPEISVPAFEKKTAAKAKPKVAKPKPLSKPVSKPANNNGPVYLLLFANGKYKELSESELNTEAAGVLKDQSLRLIKGQCLVPQISFKVADEE